MKRELQPSCDLQAATQPSTAKIKLLVQHLQTQINEQFAQYSDEVKTGFITLSGLQATRITNVTVNKARLTRCDVSQRVLQLKDMELTCSNPNVTLTLFGGFKVETPLELKLAGVDILIETDCSHTVTVLNCDFKQLTLTQPAVGTKLRRILDTVVDVEAKLKSALDSYVIGQSFTLPQSVSDTPFLCT